MGPVGRAILHNKRQRSAYRYGSTAFWSITGLINWLARSNG